MRAIAENTLALLKSQRMLGQDKYNYELKLEGYDAGYGDIENTLTQTISTSATWGDYCIRSDGKVLYAYHSGTGIYLKVIESEDVMLSTYDSGSGGTLFYTLGENITGGCFSLIRLKNGKILLIINDGGNFTTSIPHATKVYTSNNGLGTDFALTSTLGSSARIGTNLSYMKSYVAKSTQGADGAIFIATYERRSESGYDMVQIVIYKSIDNGATWAKKYANVLSWSNRYESLRSFAIIGNMVILAFTYTYATVDAYAMISTDYGETWVVNKTNFVNLPEDAQGHALIDFAIDLSSSLFMIISTGPTLGTASLYKAITTKNMTYDLLNTWNNWLLVKENIKRYYYQEGFLTISPRGTIHFLFHELGTSVKDTGMIRTLYSAAFPASSLSISKGRGGANSLNISADNANGRLNFKNPDRDLYGILNLNKQIIVKMGYGEDLIEVFTGLIDEFSMKTYPQMLEITCRDNLKKALDQTITEAGQHTVSFENTAIESVFGYLCYLGGIATGKIEETGINITKVFSWQSYADAFQFLADLASFEFGADEYGKMYFTRDHQPDNMQLAYTFEEGIDIASMSYKLADKDLYYKVEVYGKDSEGTVLVYQAPFLDAAKYNILPQKILKIDATETGTVAELKMIAERAIYLMNSRTAIVDFSAVAVPWLQVGDFIQVMETSTMSAGIYRISSLNLKMTDRNFMMDISTYYYGDSIVSGDLPTEAETQTANAALNLIPEMTSNTAPSGIAKASSIYNSNYEPWQAFNSTNTDYYWNCYSSYGWIEYQFAKNTIIDKYMLKARQAIDYNDAMPKNWSLEAFDGDKWIILDSRTNQTAWAIDEQRSYNFVNTKAYAKYRLNVSANNGFNRLQLEQLAMYYRGGI